MTLQTAEGPRDFRVAGVYYDYATTSGTVAIQTGADNGDTVSLTLSAVSLGVSSVAVDSTTNANSALGTVDTDAFVAFAVLSPLAVWGTHLVSPWLVPKVFKHNRKRRAAVIGVNAVGARLIRTINSASSDIQIDAVAKLCRDIMSRRAIPPARVLAHSDIAPGRKVDPGEKFPWDRLAAEGVGLWRPPAPDTEGLVLGFGASGAAVARLQQGLSSLGYGVESTGVYDASTRTVVEAFQRRWRPGRVDGVADPSTVATLRSCLA